MNKPIPTVMHPPDPALSEEEEREARGRRVDAYIAAEKARVAKLLSDVVAECESDPLFLARLMKALPKAKPGRVSDEEQQRAVVRHIVNACPGWTATELIGTIAKTLNLSDARGRTLYYKYKP